MGVIALTVPEPRVSRRGAPAASTESYTGDCGRNLTHQPRRPPVRGQIATHHPCSAAEIPRPGALVILAPIGAVIEYPRG